MIDTDKYEGVEEVYLCEELHKGWTDVISKETNQPIARIYCADTVRSYSPTPAHHILMDAFKMYREVKRLREAIADITTNMEAADASYMGGFIEDLRKVIE
tara:strand:+ start:825 stop:1127 length:303 start_codon:yes stop_codon:yes gene_type:complete